ncbi:platelet binding protein GspB [Chaetodon trifascialis]|uniref:platelet binding protein GspB n=1 Tax=Chaetodon trifascialis TaxID=109706 RepID=UPI003993439F
MKPDGVATAALEPMETLESNPVNEAEPNVGQEPNQAASPVEEEMPQQPVGETGQVEPQPDQAKETPAAKTSSKTSGDSKAKTTNKATAKSKPGTTCPAKPTSGSRPNTSQSRLSNGVSKPQTNGDAKKAPPAAVKKSTPTTASTKKPTGPAGAPASKSKVAEKKATGTATNGAKPTTGTAAAKKTPSTTANGVKSSTTAAAAKKPPASKPASATPTKPSSAASPKPPASKTARPTAGTAASPRPATGSTRPPTTSTSNATKSSLTTAKSATPKTSSSTTAKLAASKPTSTTPSGGKPPTSQTPRNTTPVKKDVTKPATAASKKLSESPLTRPSSTTKAAKPETPKSASKSDVPTKKPTASKATDIKTPNRSKTQDSKTPSKDVSKTPGSKATKTSSPKKPAGTSTPTPVKRAPKAATAAEPEKETAAAAVVAAAAAIATAAAAIARPEEPEPPAEAAVEPSAAPELIASHIEVVHEKPSEPTPESVTEPVLDALREPAPEPIRDLTPAPVREPTPEPIREPTPEPVREPTPEPVREPTPEPVREPTPEPVREPTPEPVREPTPEPVREPTPEPVREPTPELARETSPEPLLEPQSQPTPEPDVGAEQVHEPASNVQLSAQLDLFKFEDSANNSVPSLGTTVMSPPCSPPGPVSPVREPQNASSLLDMHIQPDHWDNSQPQAPSDFAPQSLINMMTEEEKENKEQLEAEEKMEEEEEDEEEEKENLFMPTSTAPSAEVFGMMAQPHLGASPMDDFTSRHLVSPHEKEEAVEKADEEINEDDDDEEEDEDEEQRRLGHQPSSMATDMSTSQPSEEFQVRSSAFGGSAGWHGDDLLSGMDSEDVSSCTSSRQQGVSDLSSTLHTAILEGTQSSDALVDSSLRGSEGDCNLMGSPNVETLANEEDEDEEDERVDDMDLSSEKVEEHHKVFQQQEQDEDEEDEDVEMHSEGVTESCGNADEDDFNEEERLDNFNRSDPPPCIPPASSWGQTNPFSDPWAQPASLLSVSSPSPLSDHGAAESETPTLSPAQARLDSSAPSFADQSEDEPEHHQSAHEEVKSSAPEEAQVLLAAPAMGMSQPAHSSSETSTPEELRDYDSSSGVESHSDKQQTPVPASVQPDMEQDLGIHLEKGDGEEEEAETLPADEVLGTGPPTAPASAPSSPSTSGDEASDTEGEMQINDPDAPVMMDESAGFESPTPTCSLPALEEDEEAVDTVVGEGEEDGGGTTPQSANSVASYGFDCTTSNSNAHSMAESCGKSPGIFSLENEEQLPEEAKDPSLIKELTLPSAAAAAQAEDLLGRHVDLMPLGHPGENQPSLDEHHYMLGGKIAADHLEEVDPLEPSHHLGAQEPGDTGDSQPAYYSTICDKTDSFLAGDEKTYEVDQDYKLQTRSQEDNRNQNHTTTVPIANGHYLALVPGNRRPIDPTLAAHFAKIATPPPLIETGADCRIGGEQLRRLEQHQQKLREMQHRQEQERQKRQWLEEERLRLEQQKQLEKQRRELLQLQLQQQQQEHRHHRQVLQWQLELEQQYRMQQKQIQQQQQLRRSPTGVMLSPSSGLCTIYEAMETSDEEDEARGAQRRSTQVVGKRVPYSQSVTQDFQRQLRPVPPQELEWNKKVDMVQQLINQTLMLSGDRDCPPLLLLPVGTGGTLSPLESSMWPNLLPQFSPPAATVTSVSSYSPDSQGSSSPGDWTVVEVETHH